MRPAAGCLFFSQHGHFGRDMQGSTAAQPIRIQQIPCRCPWAVGSSQQQLSIFSRGEKKQPELMQRSHTALLDAPSKPSDLPWKNPTFSLESFDF